MDLPDIINPLLKQYVENTVIPRYDSFDKGHQRDILPKVIGTFDGTDRKYLEEIYQMTGQVRSGSPTTRPGWPMLRLARRLR